MEVLKKYNPNKLLQHSKAFKFCIYVKLAFYHLELKIGFLKLPET